MKSDIEIAKFVYHHIKGSELECSVNGKLSDKGRPNGSENEDIVISVLSNKGAGQVQEAFVNVNIYVKDQRNKETKSWEKHTTRIDALCNLSKFLFSIRGGDFHVIADSCSQTAKPTGVAFNDSHTEHFINNKLLIQISNE